MQPALDFTLSPRLDTNYWSSLALLSKSQEPITSAYLALGGLYDSQPINAIALLSIGKLDTIYETITAS